MPHWGGFCGVQLTTRAPSLPRCPLLDIDGYSVTFVKRDKGINAREYDLDREVWLMLLEYPLDARSTLTIAISGFAMLYHIHESEEMSRIVIKACLNSENLVPPSVVVGVGEGPRVKTWTVLVYGLSASNVGVMGDEDAFIPKME
jgi:hypothetical protein